MESKSGLMNLVMKATGRMTKQTDLVSFTMPMVTFTRENGETTRPMVEAHTLMLTEPSILVSGKTINSTALVLRHGLTTPSMRVSTMRARRTEEAS